MQLVLKAFYGSQCEGRLVALLLSANVLTEGLFTQKNSKKFEKNPKKIRKKPKKFQKIQGFFWRFKIRIPYLGVKKSSNLAFKSFFIHKILVHPKKSEKTKKSEKSEKILGFFLEDLKSLHIWEWTIPRIWHCTTASPMAHYGCSSQLLCIRSQWINFHCDRDAHPLTRFPNFRTRLQSTRRDFRVNGLWQMPVSTISSDCLVLGPNFFKLTTIPSF